MIGHSTAGGGGTAPPPSAPGLFIRAIVERDEGLLARLGREDPVRTLARLDAAMRGLTFGLSPFEWQGYVEDDEGLRRWLDWALEQDRILRRQAGPRQREADLATLRAAYRAGDLAMVVGAGASVAAGMPGWSDLVVELIDRALKEGTPAHRAELLADFRARADQGEGTAVIGGEVYIVDEARYAALLDDRLRAAPEAVRARLENARAVLVSGSPNRSEALRDAGEGVVEVFGDQFVANLRPLLFDRVLRRTRLHPAIARMVRPPETDAGLTPRVFVILTYNFDDLLETAIREAGHETTAYLSRGGEAGALRPGAPLARPDAPSAVDIVHVHGLVPAPQGAFAFVPLEDVDVVLSESQYRARYGDETGWVRMVQWAFFGNAPCLIIGSSLTDDDAVAQLSGAHTQRPGWFSYAVMLLPEALRANREALSGEELEELGAAHHALGLRTLWVSDHEELPDLLDAVSQVPADKGTSAGKFPAALLRAPWDPAASGDLGIVLAQAGDPEGARRAFQRAIDTPGFDQVPATLRNLGVLLTEIGELDAAVDAFSRVADSDDPEQAAAAANNLGAVLEGRGDLAGAEQAYRRAAASGVPDEARGGRLNLARLRAVPG